MDSRLRHARPDDAAAVAELLDALGHPTGSDAARERLERIASRERTGVLVADEGGTAVALAAWDTYEQLHRPWPVCRITTVVVHIDHRRRGLAQALLSEIQAIALREGCGRLEVITAHGEDARALYRSFGFAEQPVRFVKELNA